MLKKGQALFALEGFGKNKLSIFAVGTIEL